MRRRQEPEAPPIETAARHRLQDTISRAAGVTRRETAAVDWDATPFIRAAPPRALCHTAVRRLDVVPAHPPGPVFPVLAGDFAQNARQTSVGLLRFNGHQEQLYTDTGSRRSAAAGRVRRPKTHRRRGCRLPGARVRIGCGRGMPRPGGVPVCPARPARIKILRDANGSDTAPGFRRPRRAMTASRRRRSPRIPQRLSGNS